MASILVKRAVDSGDIFVVIKNTVYVGNVSRNGLRQEVGHVSTLTGLGL